MNPESGTPSDFCLTAREVHVWSADLDLSERLLTHYSGLLSADEQDRAARFAFARDRQRYIAAHGVLRSLLGRYLQSDPAAITFSTSQNGKPVLADPFSRTGINFNLSHSYDRALFGFVLERPVGVDIEQVRDIPEMEQIIAHHFTAAERAAVSRYTGTELLTQFFRVWVVKEALAKAEGRGLLTCARAASLATETAGMMSLTTVGDESGDRIHWTAIYLEQGPGWVAAVVVAGKHRQVKVYDWPCHQHLNNRA